jgi:hypothetical protein
MTLSNSYADSGDHEAAHSTEDQMMVLVLTAIAEGHGAARALAKLAIVTQKLDFQRPCA